MFNLAVFAWPVRTRARLELITSFASLTVEILFTRGTRARFIMPEAYTTSAKYTFAFPSDDYEFQ